MHWLQSTWDFIAQTDWRVLVGVLFAALILVGIYSTRVLAYVLIVGLTVAHHDFWTWQIGESRSIGELPSGFVYHVGLSIAAAVVWWIVTMEAWPDDEDDFVGATSVSNDRVGESS